MYDMLVMFDRNTKMLGRHFQIAKLSVGDKLPFSHIFLLRWVDLEGSEASGAAQKCLKNQIGKKMFKLFFAIQNAKAAKNKRSTISISIFCLLVVLCHASVHPLRSKRMGCNPCFVTKRCPSKHQLPRCKATRSLCFPWKAWIRVEPMDGLESKENHDKLFQVSKKRDHQKYHSILVWSLVDHWKPIIHFRVVVTKLQWKPTILENASKKSIGYPLEV